MPEQSPKTSESAVPAVAVERLSVSFGDFRALVDISFEVPRGSVCAIIGPNGSGKTTLIRAILGLTETVSGDVRFFGRPLEEARHSIGYVPQRFEFDRHFPITVAEFMQLSRAKGGKAAAATALKEVGLLPAILKKRLGSLSGGQLQRVLIAQAVMKKPEILIMDEPASGIDIVGEATFYGVIEHLKEHHGTTILMVSHDLAVVSSFVDGVICVNKRLVCSGSPKTTLTQETLKEVFGHHAHFYQHDRHGEHEHESGHGHDLEIGHEHQV